MGRLCYNLMAMYVQQGSVFVTRSNQKVKQGSSQTQVGECVDVKATNNVPKLFHFFFWKPLLPHFINYIKKDYQTWFTLNQKLTIDLGDKAVICCNFLFCYISILVAQKSKSPTLSVYHLVYESLSNHLL